MTSILKLRGLPFDANAIAICEFFDNNIIEESIYFVADRSTVNSTRPHSGEAFVIIDINIDNQNHNSFFYELIARYHKKYMGNRYVEVLESSKMEMEKFRSRLISVDTPFVGDLDSGEGRFIFDDEQNGANVNDEIEDNCDENASEEYQFDQDDFVNTSTGVRGPGGTKLNISQQRLMALTQQGSRMKNVFEYNDKKLLNQFQSKNNITNSNGNGLNLNGNGKNNNTLIMSKATQLSKPYKLRETGMIVSIDNIIRIRGIPYQSSKDDIIQAFIAATNGELVFNLENVVLERHTHGMRYGQCTGQCYIISENEEERHQIMETCNSLDKPISMGSRYLELFLGSHQDLAQIESLDDMFHGTPKSENNINMFNYNGTPKSGNNINNNNIIRNPMLPQESDDLNFDDLLDTDELLDVDDDGNVIPLSGNNSNTNVSAMNLKLNNSNMDSTVTNSQQLYNKFNAINQNNGNTPQTQNHQTQNSAQAQYTHKLNQFISNNNSKRGAIVKLRGLPFKATKRDIVEFFSIMGGFHDVDPVLDVFILLNNLGDGRPTGDALVSMPSVEQASEAQIKLNRKHMENRYIEVSIISKRDLGNLDKQGQSDGPGFGSSSLKNRGNGRTNNSTNPNIISINSNPFQNNLFSNNSNNVRQRERDDHRDSNSNSNSNTIIGRNPNGLNQTGPSGLGSNSKGRGKTQRQASSCWLRLRGLPFSATESDVVQFFNFEYNLSDDSIMFDGPDGCNDGTAYIKLNTAEEVTECVERFHKKDMGHRWIEVLPTSEGEARRKLGLVL